jgi:tetratricopeptide (TPR) repeat protein
MLAYALGHYGILCWLRGEFEEADHSFSESLPLSQSVNDRWQLALFTTFMGMAVHDRGDYDEAYRLLSEAMQHSRSLGDPRLVALTSGYLSRTAHGLGRLAEMSEYLREGLLAAQRTNDRIESGLALERKAFVAEPGWEHSEPYQLLEETIAVSRETGDWWSLSRWLIQAGQFAIEQGDEDLARAHFKEACKAGLAAHVLPNVLSALAGLAILSMQEGDYKRAMTLALFIQRDPASTKATRYRAERLRAELGKQFSLQQIEALQSHVKSMSLEMIVQEIIG